MEKLQASNHDSWTSSSAAVYRASSSTTGTAPTATTNLPTKSAIESSTDTGNRAAAA